jgi:hypothetical protein
MSSPEAALVTARFLPRPNQPRVRQSRQQLPAGRVWKIILPPRPQRLAIGLLALPAVDVTVQSAEERSGETSLGKSITDSFQRRRDVGGEPASEPSRATARRTTGPITGSDVVMSIETPCMQDDGGGGNRTRVRSRTG